MANEIVVVARNAKIHKTRSCSRQGSPFPNNDKENGEKKKEKLVVAERR